MEASTARFRFIGGGGGRICDATVGGGGAGRFGARAPPDMDTGAKRLKLRLWERERGFEELEEAERERIGDGERERERRECKRFKERVENGICGLEREREKGKGGFGGK